MIKPIQRTMGQSQPKHLITGLGSVDAGIITEPFVHGAGRAGRRVCA